MCIRDRFNCETQQFYSESDTVAFRQFLQEKYGTLEALNQAWGAVFWDQTYTSWEQVLSLIHICRRCPPAGG